MRQIPRGIWVLLSANVVIALGFGLIAPVLPSFARSFDVSYTAVSAVISAFAVMRLLFAPASGRLVTVLGERRVYLSGLLIVAASTLACAFAQNYAQLLVFRGLGGIGSTMFTVSAMALLIRLSPNEIRGRVSGFFSAGFLIGNITGPLIGAALVNFGLRMPFVVYAVALIVATLLVAVALRDAAAPAVDTPDQPGVMKLRTALADSAYRAIIASNFAQGWASMGVRVAIVPLFIVDGLDASDSMAGVTLAVYAAGNVLAILAAGRFSDRFGRRPVMLPGLAIMAVATTLLGFSPNLPVAMALSLFAGVGSGLFAPTHQAALADVLGARRQGGSALAAFSMASDLGAVSGPLVAGFVADRAGFGPAFVLSGLVAAVAFVLWCVARETAPAVVGAPAKLRSADGKVDDGSINDDGISDDDINGDGPGHHDAHGSGHRGPGNQGTGGTRGARSP